MPTFASRCIRTSQRWLDPDGAKVYTIAVDDSPVDHAWFSGRLVEIKLSRKVTWSTTPHFAIFHRGMSHLYLVLAWWGNDNELFTSVSVATAAGWLEQPDQYSFCLYDLEVFWAEREAYIDAMCRPCPDIGRYRAFRRSDWSLA